MKKIIPGSCLLLISNALIAQMPSITLDTIGKRSLVETQIKNSLLSQGKFSHTTSKGKVYILPYDNMPCLVPDMEKVAQMPGSTQKLPESRMPNAIPRRELIPKQKKSSE
ncbi:MAG TPA: hypothetical protein VKA49_04730 [Flavitalea sp.]|nr:hypothetical protein [Flavitalea sp.]